VSKWILCGSVPLVPTIAMRLSRSPSQSMTFIVGKSKIQSKQVARFLAIAWKKHQAPMASNLNPQLDGSSDWNLHFRDYLIE
jgi:hypothetical protein